MAFEVERYFIHPLYQIGSWVNNDIALIRLKSSIPFCREVAPVCLPEVDVSPGKICVTTGWGSTVGGYDIIWVRVYNCLFFFVLKFANEKGRNKVRSFFVFVYQEYKRKTKLFFVFRL